MAGCSAFTMLGAIIALHTFLVFTLARGSAAGPFLDKIALRGESVPISVFNPARAAPTGCSAIYSCADCKTARLCRPLPGGGFTPVQDLPCPKVNPYCQIATGTCGPNPDKSCGRPDTFVCTREGYFPDPADCSVYHYCDASFKSSAFKCLSQGYDSRSEACSGVPVQTCKGKPPLDCKKVSPGRKLQFANDTRFFGYCGPAGNAAIVDRCDGDYRLNATSQLCGPACDRTGAVADNADCTKFYRCTIVIVGNGVKVPIQERGSCPKGLGFDPSHGMCADLTTLPDCLQKSLN